MADSKPSLAVPEFNEYLKEIRDSSYNSLVISAEIVPVLNEKYAPVYDKIVSYNNQIDNSKGDISKLKAIKSELAFRYDIPNRQYISEQVNRYIKKIEIKEYTFKLEKDSIISNPQLSSLIQAVIPGTDLANGDIQKVKPFKLLDITRDACDLSVKRLKNISLPTKGTKILNYSNTYKQTMSIDIETYRLKAQEAIEYVFVKEYHNSLGIPMPIVKMLLPDDANYSTGQYYITIDKTWQIHLNFGKLPISYHEFQNEVKVLTRHEIEHYMCCPFDVITHFRMLKELEMFIISISLILV